LARKYKACDVTCKLPIWVLQRFCILLENDKTDLLNFVQGLEEKTCSLQPALKKHSKKHNNRLLTCVRYSKWHARTKCARVTCYQNFNLFLNIIDIKVEDFGDAKFWFCPYPIKFAQNLITLPKFRFNFAQILPKSNQICPNLTKFDQKFARECRCIPNRLLRHRSSITVFHILYFFFSVIEIDYFFNFLRNYWYNFK